MRCNTINDCGISRPNRTTSNSSLWNLCSSGISNQTSVQARTPRLLHQFLPCSPTPADLSPSSLSIRFSAGRSSPNTPQLTANWSVLEFVCKHPTLHAPPEQPVYQHPFTGRCGPESPANYKVYHFVILLVNVDPLFVFLNLKYQFDCLCFLICRF